MCRMKSQPTIRPIKAINAPVGRRFMHHRPAAHRRRWHPCWSLIALLVHLAGCGAQQKGAPSAHTEPRVEVTHPARRTIERTVGQPAFVNAYEQTSIYPKISGYVKKWNVDIGDRIEKDSLLADLFVPELDAQFDQQQAEVARDEILIQVAKRTVEVAERQLQVAAAEFARAKADVGKYQSAVERWESEVKRLGQMVEERVVDRQVLDESQKQLKSNIAARDAAMAAVTAAEASELAQQATLDKSRVDVDAARANTKVAQTVEQRYAALVSYTRLTAPYDGIVVIRNANTGDFVQPALGDKSIDQDTANRSSMGTPVYVVARTDLVRIFVDIPELDANHVSAGTEARVRIQALDDTEIPGTVTRTSWALNVQSRTLRAEIDLPNPDAKMLPGMYAYAMVLIKREHVMSLPVAAIVEAGNQSYCYLLVNGKAVQTPIQTGISDGHWTEVARKQVRGDWVPLTGDEEVMLGDLSEIGGGQAVEVLTPNTAPPSKPQP
jgi:RND family efflux transporter MFP subunit